MQTLRMRPTVAVKPALRARRPPETYVELLSKSEEDFYRYIENLEAHPLFRKLLQDGLVSKVRFRGKIPRDKYEEYMDREVFAFLQQSGITQHEGWEKDLLKPSALQHIPELAQKYGVAQGTLRRCVRYLLSTQREEVFVDGFARRQPADEEEFDPLDLASGDTQVDLSDLIEIFTRFKDKYDLTEQDFVDDILHGDLTAEELAERYGCTLREAEEVLEAADRVAFVETYETSTVAPTGSASAAPQPAEPLAHVSVNPDGSLAIQFASDSVYVQRYRIRARDEYLPSEVREILSQLRFINQRLNTLSRMITVLCERQKKYLATGNPLYLKPLSQADVARALKSSKGDKTEHASTVCRLIRGKFISTPHGILPLTFFCQSKTDVIARVVREYPDKSDNQIRAILESDYDCKIARRTVSYHRGKREHRKPIRSRRPATS
ncbi:MAG: hypothetical protein NZT92_09685 [Abditibacteriales bacterium]|nr:hypothetical protein [Abditibacteriales bacterium]MDW8365156.1 hypothetical protein [Abditibacteriales bacterium]